MKRVIVGLVTALWCLVVWPWLVWAHVPPTRDLPVRSSGARGKTPYQSLPRLLDRLSWAGKR